MVGRGRERRNGRQVGLYLGQLLHLDRGARLRVASGAQEHGSEQRRQRPNTTGSIHHDVLGLWRGRARARKGAGRYHASLAGHNGVITLVYGVAEVQLCKRLRRWLS